MGSKNAKNGEWENGVREWRMGSGEWENGVRRMENGECENGKNGKNEECKNARMKNGVSHHSLASLLPVTFALVQTF